MLPPPCGVDIGCTAVNPKPVSRATVAAGSQDSGEGSSGCTTSSESMDEADDVRANARLPSPVPKQHAAKVVRHQGRWASQSTGAGMGALSTELRGKKVS